jgi:hypothetical protein
VTVNRFWEQLFGTGIVSTPEDFGIQGEWPSHPELLDWLAVEFQSDWDIKRLLKLMVMSATYRQSSRHRAEVAEKDPAGRYLAVGPRQRHSAELIRDQALAASGLLSMKMHGPSVRPTRPNLGLSAAFGGNLDWKTSEGEDRYRRALYTEWRRTSPYPSMVMFDAPSREACTLRRIRTNTPLQALVTLNDPVYVECAQALARRALTAHASTDDRIRFAFAQCLIREPSEAEVQRLRQLHDQLLKSFEADEAKALQLATEPLGPLPKDVRAADAATWTALCNVLLNLDEFLMRP